MRWQVLSIVASRSSQMGSCWVTATLIVGCLVVEAMFFRFVPEYSNVRLVSRDWAPVASLFGK